MTPSSEGARHLGAAAGVAGISSSHHAPSPDLLPVGIEADPLPLRGTMHVPPATGDPMILDTFARTPLTFGPSPVQPLQRLTRHLGGATLWAKREDVNSGLAFG